MEKLLEYKCPCCGAALAYDGKSGGLRCASCGNKFSVEQLSQCESNLGASGEKSDYKWDEYKPADEKVPVKVFVCKSCGAEIDAEETTAATECPYCGNQIVVKEAVSGILRPDYIIPFRLDKTAAIEALNNYYKGKKLLPNSFSDTNHLEKITGIYVPFWLFDCDTDSKISYDAVRRMVWSDANYNYVRSDHYLVYRGGNVSFEKIPVDASVKMPDNYMDSLEPFDYKDAVPFLDAYMAGFFADRFDVGADESQERVNARVETSVCELFRSTVTGYASVIPKKTSVQSTDGKISYALLPVWILNTKYKDKTYMYAVNGQTGKVTGELPVDKGKAWKFFGIAAGIAFAVMNAIILISALL